MKVFSMFSGIGGFDLAMQNLGHKIVGACEIDSYARQIYSRHFPNVRIWEDARKLNPSEIPDFDILCAGFPCQAFSVAGKRLGFEDTRGTLFYEIARVARQKRPRYLFLENVKGLLNHDHGRTITAILSTFDELGYNLEWQIINSKYFVPQNRERIFIIGHIRTKPIREIFPLGSLCQVDDNSRIAPQKKREWVRGPHTRAIDANYSKGSGSRTMIMLGNIDQKGHNSIWGRVYDPSGISATLNAQGGGLGAKTGLYETQGKIRKLTPLECERLQGFPDNWTEGISDTQRYKCLGNAVTVSVVQYIASHFEKEDQT